ncbi:uncharacterized protein LOC110178086 [Drosophila serrata]|uniref:uncharacterized protein LOC110178086 n=1 Tax=Drosophila serrata TaxID=7274 RepID=UPI000A1D1259|nr:uncharacterized protein LOC110178086 [Drosophila serrata]
MIYSMRKKRQLFRIMRKWHFKHNANPQSCKFYLSCPEMDAITGPPRRDEDLIVIHPIHAFQLINLGLQQANEMGDRKIKVKLKAYRQHVQNFLQMLEVRQRMTQLNIQDVGERGQDITET